MATLLTAMTWGLGVSLGASIGMLFFVVMWRLLDLFMRSEAGKALEEVNRLSLAALDRRNELTVVQVETLGRIASALQEFSEKLESGEPVETTTVRREETPDGPMHTRTKGTL